MYKRSTVPPHQPGGGGWSLQQISLSTLYEENDTLMNFWTHTNKSLPLCRYNGCKITLFRQPDVDYIFTYSINYPQDVTKYYYASLHPFKLLNYNKKIIVPSFKTQPHKRKPYKKKFLKPPKTMVNKWYFQQHLAKYPLMLFAVTACSLTSLFQASNAINNNVDIPCINTRFFQNNCFQYPKTSQWGYQPNSTQYIYGLPNGLPDWQNIVTKQCIYLGDTMNYFVGTPPPLPITTTDKQQLSWGNPFHYSYLSGDKRIVLSTENPSEFFSSTNMSKTLKDHKTGGTLNITLKTEPLIIHVRYNPDADLGTNNEAYWLPTYTHNNNYDPTNDPDLHISNFPFWILLWGWEDFTRKINKAQNMFQDYILCLRTRYIQEKMPTYVPISQFFENGEGPYGVERDYVELQDTNHWYPRYRYQKEPIENLLMSGPGVCKSESQRSISAHMKYQFYFKWGGDPASMENIQDPLSQPTYPFPSGLETNNEIIDPQEDPAYNIYSWDVRRDLLTQAATQRITKKQTDELSLFTDGRQCSTDVPMQETPQKTSATEEKEILQKKIQLIQQRNQLLQLRYRQLRQLTMDQ